MRWLAFPKMALSLTLATLAALALVFINEAGYSQSKRALAEIGGKVVREFEVDEQSRTDWLKRTNDAIALATQDPEAHQAYIDFPATNPPADPDTDAELVRLSDELLATRNKLEKLTELRTEVGLRRLLAGGR